MSSFNLRERLQARRERIAAGKPPPPAVTVTGNFFTSNITRAAGRKCSECDTIFIPRGQQKTCSTECAKKRHYKLKRGKNGG